MDYNDEIIDIDELAWRPKVGAADLERDWQMAAKKVLRMAMMHLDLTYADVARELSIMGIPENERALRNKVSRGTFSAAFFLQALAAMRVETLDLSAITFPHEVGLVGRLSFVPKDRKPRKTGQ